MRKVFWWCSVGVAACVALAFYCWCCPDSLVGRCARAAYEFGCQTNPLNVLSRHVVTHPQGVDVLGEDALAVAKEDPRPCEEEEPAPKSVPVVPLNGLVEIPPEMPPPIVIHDDEEPKMVPANPLGVEVGLAPAGFQKQSVENNDVRPMPYAEETVDQDSIKPMPYAEEDDEDMTAPSANFWIIEDNSDKKVSPEEPKMDEVKPEEPTVPNYGTQPHDTGCPGCPGMSCPHCPSSYCPDSSRPLVTEPVPPASDSGEENCEAPKPTKKAKKHVQKKPVTNWGTPDVENNPRHPDIDTMEFGPRDYHLNEYGPGPI
jgi:hypothetical protein